MRAFIFVLIGITLAPILVGQDGKAVSVRWDRAFAPITAGQADDKLAIVLITNDEQIVENKIADPAAEKADADPVKGEKRREKIADIKQPVWCKADFEFSFRRAVSKRQGISGLCALQYQAAGMPKHLCGGQDRNQPSRCFVAICDGHYRLLSICVGVPGPDQLLTMIEDAQQASAMTKLSGGVQEKVTALVADQSMDRLARRWKYSLKEMLTKIDVGAADDSSNRPAKFQVSGVLGRITEEYEAVYLADVKLRFGLTETSDRLRLAVLEQHAQARQPWCDAMMPFLVNADFVKLWRPLTKSVWHYDAVTMNDTESISVLDWFDATAKDQYVVLDLQESTAAQKLLPLGDVGSVAAKRGLGLSDLHDLVDQFPVKNVDPQQLSDLVRDRGIKGVDVQLPSRAKYLVVDRESRKAWAIREGEPPGKNIGRLKRLVKK